MRAGVVHNNEACAMISRGCNESAIALLNKALFVLSRNGREQPPLLEERCQQGNHGLNDSSNQPQHYYPENDYDEGMRTFSQPLFIQDQSMDDSCGSTKATVFFNLGVAHSLMCNERKALAFLEEALHTQLSTASFSSHSIVRGPALHVILHNIGHSHFRSANYADAIASYGRALDVLTNASVDLHRLEISSTLNCIAVSKFYAAHDDTGDMLMIFEKALALRLDDPNAQYDRETATIINNTGRVRFLRGEFFEALTIYKKACKHRMTLLGQNHVDVAASLVNMAQSLEYLGHTPEAIDFYKHFLNIALLKRGEGANDVCRAFLRIGQISYVRGDLDEAYRFFSLALNSAKLAFGPNHDSVANIFNKLGNVLFEQSKYDEALSAYQSGLKLERALYPHFHEQIAVTFLNMGRIYHRKGELDQGLRLYTEALHIRRTLNSEETVATILFNIGMIYESQGRLDKAMDTLGEAVALHRKLNEEHSLLASTLNALGIVQHKKGSLNLALSSFLEAIKIRKSFKESSTRDIMNLYLNAATVCKIMGETEKALEFYNETLHFEKSDVHENFEQVAFVYCEMGLILKNKGNFDDALSHLKQSSQVCLENSQAIERGLAYKVFTSLGDLYRQMGDTQNALESYSAVMDADDAAEMVFGDHPGSVGDFLHALLCQTNPPAAAAA